MFAIQIPTVLTIIFQASAQNIGFLQKMGITHVLNAAEGDWEGSVDLSQEHYAGTGIKYLGLPLWDDVNARILPYLGCANEFIASAFNVSLFSFSNLT